MKVSVIISTYNNPAWLEKVIWGYERQTHRGFELVIADDGSNDSTRTVIEYYQRISWMKIVHVWHPDNGFQKSAILNKALVKATGDYIIFSDGDCIPRIDFVEVHVKNARPGFFLSGGYFKLPMSISTLITQDDIAKRRVFDAKWLIKNGLKPSFKLNKLTSRGLKEQILNSITTTKPTWNGHNSSGWKEDLIRVNGFNEDMQYGGQDREFGERLVNRGLRGLQIRYSAICIHLDHPRGYNTKASIEKNNRIRKETRDLKKVWTRFGIIKPQPLSSKNLSDLVII